MTDEIAPAGTAGRTDWRSLAAVIASISVAGMAFGITFPLTSIVLERQGIGPLVISLVAAVGAIGSVAVAPLVPSLVARYGTAQVLYAGIIATTACFLLLPVVPAPAAWFPVRFVLGAAAAAIFIVSEMWISQMVDNAMRGRAVGLYIMVLSIGIAIGPLLLILTGTDGWLPFLVGAAIVALAIIPAALAHDIAPDFGGRPSIPFLAFLRRAPSGTLAGLMMGLIESCATALLPIYALQSGIGTDKAVALLAAFTAGGVAIPPLFGWLADRIERRLALLIAAALTLATVLALPATLRDPVWVWPVVVLWGGAATSIYSIGLTLLGQRFRGADLATVNAVLVMMYSVGSVVGPAAAGGAMEAAGPDGLPYMLAAACGGYVLLIAVRLVRERRAGATARPTP